MSSIKILAVGLGPIGQKVVQYLWERNRFAIVAAVDPAPGIAGRRFLGEVCGLPGKLDVVVHAELRTAMDSCQPHLAVLCTGSSLEAAAPQVEDLTACGLPVVSTCEELSYPAGTNLPLARRIDEAAKLHGFAVLGTGVNPGFCMDFLPLTLTAICRKVQQIKVSRIQDASIRRGPFQAKIGAGLTLAQFEANRKAGAAARGTHRVDPHDCRPFRLATRGAPRTFSRRWWPIAKSPAGIGPSRRGWPRACSRSVGVCRRRAANHAGVHRGGRTARSTRRRRSRGRSELHVGHSRGHPRRRGELAPWSSTLFAPCWRHLPGCGPWPDLPPVSFFDRLAAANGEGSP